MKGITPSHRLPPESRPFRTHGTRQYLVVTTVFGFIVAVLDTIALFIMHIPLALTWGVLAFVTNFIPNVGFIIGVIPPALLALLTGPGQQQGEGRQQAREN